MRAYRERFEKKQSRIRCATLQAQAFCIEHRLTLQELQAKSRALSLDALRRRAVHFCWQNFGPAGRPNYSELGQVFRRDHSSILAMLGDLRAPRQPRTYANKQEPAT